MRRSIVLLLLLLGLAGLPRATHAAPPAIPTFTTFQSASFLTASVSELFGSATTVVGGGELMNPDRVHLLQHPSDDEETIDEIYIVGTDLYAVDPLAGVWDDLHNVPGVAGTAGITPAVPADMASSLRSITELPLETIQGVVCEHYRLDIDPARLLAIDPQSGDGPTEPDKLGVEIDLWIGQTDRFVHQQQQNIELKDPGSEEPLVGRQIDVFTYYGINQPVTITPPEIEVPPTPAVPPEGVPIYPPKYPQVGTTLASRVRALVAAAHRPH